MRTFPVLFYCSDLFIHKKGRGTGGRQAVCAQDKAAFVVTFAPGRRQFGMSPFLFRSVLKITAQQLNTLVRLLPDINSDELYENHLFYSLIPKSSSKCERNGAYKICSTRVSLHVYAPK